MAQAEKKSSQDKPKGPELEPHQIVIRPLVTEKGTHQFTRHNAYPFEVNPLATKAQIKTAIEQLFNVRVAKVRTQNRKGKPRRNRYGRTFRTKRCKKAIVTLHEEDRIEFF